jgi:uncharacterized protein YbaR (Trm112 family)
MIEPKMLESLRCPLGTAPLKYIDDTLVCTSCRLIFIIRDDIPDLLIDDAKLPEGISSISGLKCQNSLDYLK